MDNSTVAPKLIPDSLIEKVRGWLGEDNIRWFAHIKGLKGSVNCVLKLNFKRKRIPAHPIHFREGMQIRNFLREQVECDKWGHADFEREWITVVEKLITQFKAKT